MATSKYETDLLKLMKECARLNAHSLEEAACLAGADLIDLRAIATTHKGYALVLEQCEKQCATAKRLDDQLKEYEAQGLFRISPEHIEQLPDISHHYQQEH